MGKLQLTDIEIQDYIDESSKKFSDFIIGNPFFEKLFLDIPDFSKELLYMIGISGMKPLHLKTNIYKVIKSQLEYCYSLSNEEQILLEENSKALVRFYLKEFSDKFNSIVASDKKLLCAVTVYNSIHRLNRGDYGNHTITNIHNGYWAFLLLNHKDIKAKLEKSKSKK